MAKQALVRHAALLGGILLLVGVVYIRNPGTYFCAYDDFVEVHRAAFEDTEAPMRVFTTTHFESYKYRPLNRGLNLLTYSFGDGKASFFRTRNVACHLLNIVLVYILGWLLFKQIHVAAAAALLFGLHPLANQAVVGAVMTNTAAHAFFLSSLICFLLSIRKTRSSLIWLAISLVCGWLGIFLYEAGIVVFPLMAAYLLVHFAVTRKKLVDRSYLIVLTIGTLVLLGAYFAIRSQYVPYSSRNAVPGFEAMVKNAGMYAGAIVLPIDSVLANQWFGTPLPSAIELSAISTIWWILISLVVGAAIVSSVFLLRRSRRNLLASLGFPHLLLLLGILSSVSILVLFTDKASETYMYLPVAFAAPLFTSLLDILVFRRESGGKVIYGAIICCLCFLFACATWVRNSRVAQCGATAAQIVSGIRQDRLRDGIWFIWFAPAPGETQSQRYGMYGWRGIDTIGATAVEPAVQVTNGNKSLAAALVSPQFLERSCSSSRSICFLVHENGTLAEVEPKTGGKMRRAE